MKRASEKIEFSTVLASSVHDMKNSITMLLGSLSEITTEDQGVSSEIREKLIQVQHEGHRVNRDLVQLLTLYKLDRAQYHLNVDEINIFDFFNDIIIEHRELLQGRGIDISQHCDHKLSGFFDADLVASVINTIINNAYQYTKDKILLSGEYKDGFIVLSVIDNGTGYPPNMLSESCQNKTSINFVSGSTGLGLYFSSRIAELHTNKDKVGFIKLENTGETSSSNTGGCFSIFLP